MAKAAHKNKISRNTMKSYMKGYLFASPILLGVLLFSFVPIGYSLFVSFTKYDGYQKMEFIGFDNYVRLLFRDPVFWQTIWNTVYAASAVFISMAVSLLLALGLSKDIGGVRVYRTLYYIPSICSIMATSIMWRWMFNEKFGLLNQFLKLLGIKGPPWISSTQWAMPSMILNAVWGGLGFNMILFLAALKSVNRSYYEAADIDGANVFQKFFKITLPAISPTTFFILITSIIGAMQDFTRFMILTGGGPGKFTTTTIVYYIWLNFRNYTGEVGYASAMAWMLGIVILILTAFNFVSSKKWVHYE